MNLTPNQNPHELTPPQRARLEELTTVNNKLKSLFKDFTLLTQGLNDPTYDEVVEEIRKDIKNESFYIKLARWATSYQRRTPQNIKAEVLTGKTKAKIAIEVENARIKIENLLEERSKLLEKFQSPQREFVTTYNQDINTIVDSIRQQTAMVGEKKQSSLEFDKLPENLKTPISLAYEEVRGKENNNGKYTGKALAAMQKLSLEELYTAVTYLANSIMGSFYVADNIQHMAILDENKRLKIAELVAQKAPWSLEENFKNFQITTESAKVILAETCLKSENRGSHTVMMRIMKNFEFQTEKNRQWLAEIFYKSSPKNVINELEIFNIQDTEWLHRLFNNAIDNREFIPTNGGDHITRNLNLKLAGFKLSEEKDEAKRFIYAKAILFQNPRLFVEQFEAFNITDQSVKDRFFNDCLKLEPPLSEIFDEKTLEKFGITDKNMILEAAKKQITNNNSAEDIGKTVYYLKNLIDDKEEFIGFIMTRIQERMHNHHKNYGTRDTKSIIRYDVDHMLYSLQLSNEEKEKIVDKINKELQQKTPEKGTSISPLS